MSLIKMFKEKALGVSAVVGQVGGLKEAFEYTVDLCRRRQACRLLVSGCEWPLSPGGSALCEEKDRKIIAAPGLNGPQAALFSKICEAGGIDLITQGLRQHLAGVDIGFTIAAYGIAETGTLVIDAKSEQVRLATMVSEIHVAVMPVSCLFESSFALEAELSSLVSQSAGYTTFITGASRTADIERVLELGVHGPLELHILLWGEDDANC